LDIKVKTKNNRINTEHELIQGNEFNVWKTKEKQMVPHKMLLMLQLCNQHEIILKQISQSFTTIVSQNIKNTNFSEF